MTGNTGAYIVFLLGILVGMILGNKDFRVKFFKGFRHFLAGVGKGAREYNQKYTGGKQEVRTTFKEPEDRRERDERNVRHIYKQVHVAKKCPTCDGERFVFKKHNPLQEGALGFKPEAIECPTCGGEGKVWD